MDRHDVLIGAVLAAAGITVITLMAYPLVSPRQLFERPAGAPNSVLAAFARRWPPPLAKTDRLAAAEPIDAGVLQPVLGEERPTASPPPAAPIEQAVERKAFDTDVERLERQYHRSARKLVAENDDERPGELCARHGMRRVYYGRRHRSWRCVGRGR